MDIINNFVMNLGTSINMGTDFTSINNSLHNIITENITYGYTAIKEVFQNDYYMYFTLLTMSICAPISYYILYYQQISKNGKNTKNLNNEMNVNNTTNMNLQQDKNKILVHNLNGLYLQSIKEINEKGKQIVDSLNKDNSYWILLRVQMKNYIQMNPTICELHGNYISGKTNENFTTRDMYMIVRFKSVYESKSDILFGNVIVRFMNYLNKLSDKQYHTTDFIICAIGTTPYTDSIEYTNGLKNINYEMNNFKNIIVKTENNIQTINYSLMLPVHNIYDLFMDVYNNIIYESNKYVIDDDNYESWDNQSINNLGF
jgi:hypothetical protein